MHAQISPPQLSPVLRRLSALFLFALLILCVVWEAYLAPVVPGGSWLILKALPLAFPLRNILRGNIYTYQWASMLVLLYLAEGAMRAMSDLNPVSVMLAWGEIVLSTGFFLCAILYVRPAKRAAKLARRANSGAAQ